MATKVKSVRGEMVDFDLLRTKQELSEKDPVLEVRDREDFVHTKRRTRGRAALIKRLNEKKNSSNTTQREENKEDDNSSTAPKKNKPKRKIVKKDSEE